jgi:hypothetical protein
VRHAIYSGEPERYYMLYNLFTSQSLYMVGRYNLKMRFDP